MSAATRSRTPDRLCADAVELAQQAAVEAAHPQQVGAHLGAEAEDDRVVTHVFEALDPGYRGWHWRVTVARAARARYVTIDEVTLAPGEGALLAPVWLPWHQRLRPGDLGPGDLLPAEPDDPRLVPGWSGEEEPPPNAPEVDQVTTARSDGAATSPLDRALPPEPGSVAADQPPAGAGATVVGSETTGAGAPVAGAREATASEAEADRSAPAAPGAEATDTTASGAVAASETEPQAGPGTTPAIAEAPERTGAPAATATATDRGAIASVAHELGLGRVRVLSRLGLREAAERWEENLGPRTAMAEGAPADCGSCGFLVPMTGSLSQEFGICANEYAPADGRVVSLSFGCGAHSEAAKMPASPQPPPPVIDHLRVDRL